MPAGEQISFFGYSWSSSLSGAQTYPPVVTSTGPQNTYTVALRIPASAPVGDVYDVNAERSDDVQSLLWLYDNYEVCSFAASQKSSCGAGRASARSHRRQQATLFMRNIRAGQPATAKAGGLDQGRWPHGRPTAVSSARGCFRRARRGT